MSRLIWDAVSEKEYELGVSNGVLYVQGSDGTYPEGVAWNGLISVTEQPTGAEANPQWADNIKYANLYSIEQFEATLEAFTYPDEFEVCDGTASLTPGVTIGQQNRKPFGLSYQTIIGNDTEGMEHGRKIHIIYGAMASPSEKNYQTINDSPEAITFSWSMTTTPVAIPGYKPSAKLTIDSTLFTKEQMKEIEDILYGTTEAEARLPLPAEIASILGEEQEG